MLIFHAPIVKAARVSLVDGVLQMDKTHHWGKFCLGIK